MKVRKTTFSVDGVKEPCINVHSDDGFVKVRISKCYHFIGSDSIYVTEFLGGKLNSQEELYYGFDILTLNDAIRIAKEYSAYLK